MASQQVIPMVALGVYRHVAASTVDLFAGTPYTMAAILDLKESPEAYRYTPHNLGVVLHTLIPRPQVFCTGVVVSEDMTNESIKIWEEYVKVTGVKDTLVINMQSEPPKDGDWKAHIMRILDKKFGKENM